MPHKACREPTDVADANRSGVIPVSPRVRPYFGFFVRLFGADTYYFVKH